MHLSFHLVVRGVGDGDGDGDGEMGLGEERWEMADRRPR